MNFEYTGAVQTTTLAPAIYKLQCWGAQGGTYQTYLGGFGGYSEGQLIVTKATNIYVYVGGQPAENSSSRVTTNGGFNGGGNGFNRYYSSTYTYGQGGGGASDIRIGSDSLYARVIVAGGGGGSASNSTDTGLTKYGGGEVAGAGGASLTSSYNAGQTTTTTSSYYKAGTFGQGANAYTNRSNYKYGSGGGGGGWYGGYAYNYSTDSDAPYQTYNGGGSGYVYTKETASNYPSGCLLDSTYYLSVAQTIGGNGEFPTIDNTSTETGHRGNGYVVITRVGDLRDLKTYIKVGGEYKKAALIFKKVRGVWVEQEDNSCLKQSLEFITKDV